MRKPGSGIRVRREVATMGLQKNKKSGLSGKGSDAKHKERRRAVRAKIRWVRQAMSALWATSAVENKSLKSRGFSGIGRTQSCQKTNVC